MLRTSLAMSPITKNAFSVMHTDCGIIKWR